MFLDFETLEASASMSSSALGPPKLNGSRGMGSGFTASHSLLSVNQGKPFEVIKIRENRICTNPYYGNLIEVRRQ